MSSEVEALVGEGESLDRLTARRQVIQRVGGHRSATDDLLAAWSARRLAPEARAVLDLGCGHGTVTLLLSTCLADARFVGVEAQAVSADLARRNMRLNGLQERAQIMEGDLRCLAEDQALCGRFDLVTGTPPFIPPGHGTLPRDPQRAAARFELRGGIEEYCRAAAAALLPSGWVSMLMDAAQDERCRAAFQAADLRLERVSTVIPRQGRRPRFRIYGGCPASAGSSEIEEDQLVVRGADGAYTREMLAIRALFGAG